MDASALDEILNWMDADGYGVPIGTHERKDEAREELAALRARLRNAEQVIADANHVGTTGGVYGWASKAGRSRNARAVFLASLDAYTKTYLTAEACRALRRET